MRTTTVPPVAAQAARVVAWDRSLGILLLGLVPLVLALVVAMAVALSPAVPSQTGRVVAPATVLLPSPQPAGV